MLAEKKEGREGMRERKKQKKKKEKEGGKKLVTISIS